MIFDSFSSSTEQHKMKIINGNKRARAAAFTDDERLILREVMEPFSTTLQNKKTDSTSVLRKKEAWIAIQYSYNSYANVTHRTGDQLRKAWDNMKTRDKHDSRGLRQTQPADCDMKATASGDSDSLPRVNSPPLHDSNSPAFCLLGLTVSDDDADLPRVSAQPDCKSRYRSSEEASAVLGAAQQHALHSMQLREARAIAEAAELRLELLKEELSYQHERHELQLREARAVAEAAELRVEVEQKKLQALI